MAGSPAAVLSFVGYLFALFGVEILHSYSHLVKERSLPPGAEALREKAEQRNEDKSGLQRTWALSKNLQARWTYSICCLNDAA